MTYTPFGSLDAKEQATENLAHLPLSKLMFQDIFRHQLLANSSRELQRQALGAFIPGRLVPNS